MASSVVERIPHGAQVVRAARARLAPVLGRAPLALSEYDAYVVGYPKVGNTWFQIMLRMALVRYYGLGDEWLSKIIYPQVGVDEPPPPPVPRITLTHDMRTFPQGAYPEVQRDHRRYRGKPVVLLVREPKDALVSLYMHYVYRDEATPYEGTADEMVFDLEFGLDKYLQFYRAWYRHRRWPSALHLVRYEDMKADTAAVFRGAAEFLGMRRISDAVIDECVAFGSFDNMRRMEEENALGLPALARSPRGTAGSYKVRQGIVGGYADHLSSATVAYIDRRVRDELPAVYGYPLQARCRLAAPEQMHEGVRSP